MSAVWSKYNFLKTADVSLRKKVAIASLLQFAVEITGLPVQIVFTQTICCRPTFVFNIRPTLKPLVILAI